MGTIILYTFVGIFLGGLFFALALTIFFTVKTKRFRKRCDTDDAVKVYCNEEKCYGTILRRMGDRCYVEFLDETSKLQMRYFNIKDIFPAW